MIWFNGNWKKWKKRSLKPKHLSRNNKNKLVQEASLVVQWLRLLTLSAGGARVQLRVSVLTWAPRRWGGFAGNQITTSAGNLIPAKKFPLFTFLSLPGLRCTTGNWGLMKGRVCPSTTPKAVSSPPDPWPPSTPSLGPEVLPATLYGPGVWKGSKRNREPPTNNSHCGF